MTANGRRVLAAVVVLLSARASGVLDVEQDVSYDSASSVAWDPNEQAWTIPLDVRVSEQLRATTAVVVAPLVCQATRLEDCKTAAASMREGLVSCADVWGWLDGPGASWQSGAENNGARAFEGFCTEDVASDERVGALQTTLSSAGEPAWASYDALGSRVLLDYDEFGVTGGILSTYVRAVQGSESATGAQYEGLLGALLVLVPRAGTVGTLSLRVMVRELLLGKPSVFTASFTVQSECAQHFVRPAFSALFDLRETVGQRTCVVVCQNGRVRVPWNALPRSLDATEQQEEEQRCYAPPPEHVAAVTSTTLGSTRGAALAVDVVSVAALASFDAAAAQLAHALRDAGVPKPVVVCKLVGSVLDDESVTLHATLTMAVQELRHQDDGLRYEVHNNSEYIFGGDVSWNAVMRCLVVSESTLPSPALIAATLRVALRSPEIAATLAHSDLSVGESDVEFVSRLAPRVRRVAPSVSVPAQRVGLWLAQGVLLVVALRVANG